MLTAILLSLAGLVGLALGGELLVRGAVGIARQLRISSLVTGLVIVGSATSMPEMVTSVEAALAGSPGIAWGNVAGSNIANTLLILGVTALIAPIALTGAGRRDAIVALVASVLVWIIALQGYASPWIGAALLAAIVTYVIWRYRVPRSIDEEDDTGPMPLAWRSIAFFLVGLGVLIAGGQALVTGAIDLARIFNVSETIIGMTVVAIGTSLPELAASIAAALRGKAAMAIGNVVGSNIYNLLLIGGVTMSIAPLPIPVELVDFEFPVVIASAAMLLGLCWFAKRIGRMLGAALLAGFIANTVYLFA